MTDARSYATWVDANQRLMARDFARLLQRLERANPDAADAGRDDDLASPMAGFAEPAAIDLVAEAFGLSRFERALLLLCAGVEMNAKIAAACAAATGRASATFGLALGLLDEPHWSALTPARPLRHWRLIAIETGQPLTTAPIRIDERVLHFLAGINLLDPRLAPLLRAGSPPARAATHQAALADTLAAQWLRPGAEPGVIHLGGEDAFGSEDVAGLMAARLGLQLHIVRAEDIPAVPAELETFMALWEREAALLPGMLLVQCGDGAPSQVLEFAERLRAALVIASGGPLRLRRPTLCHEVAKPDAAEQRRLWALGLGEHAGALNGALDGVASLFRLSARSIAVAATSVHERIAAGEPAAAALWRTCRGDGQHRLDALATRIPPGARWNDLVLPEPQLAALRQITAQVRCRGRVYEQWEFGRRNARGLGVTALFSGGSGTGKTLAAEVLASELDLDLYRIDLSSVVSKYIGETEKNLRRVFDAAEDSGAILLFDEADALFGKRSEVKDSHDRYANIEVSYLLQRMEAYRGLAILTTNLKSALDPSFQRRLRFVVHFPFPDAGQREAIWRRSFPAAAPISGLDFGRLARLNVAGGAVRNIALNAAFLAADAEEAITMCHLLAAAHVESAKLDRPLSETETRGWT
jgi:hypothetical protein